MLSLRYLGVKAWQYFINSSCMFLDKKTLIQIKRLNPGLNYHLSRNRACGLNLIGWSKFSLWHDQLQAYKAHTCVDESSAWKICSCSWDIILREKIKLILFCLLIKATLPLNITDIMSTGKTNFRKWGCPRYRKI